MERTAEQVAADHLDAVVRGDPTAMAADYAVDAVLERPGERFEGHAAIEAYFRTVPDRLGGARVVFDGLVVDGDVAAFRWHLEGLPEGVAPVAGVDTCVIEDGLIVHQRVRLDAADF
ncbi:MAG: nuclear transport factor 2 family protein [Actinomycetota bacterium]